MVRPLFILSIFLLATFAFSLHQDDVVPEESNFEKGQKLQSDEATIEFVADKAAIEDEAVQTTRFTTMAPEGYKWVKASMSSAGLSTCTSGMTTRRGVDEGKGWIAHTFDNCVQACNDCDGCIGFHYNGADQKNWNSYTCWLKGSATIESVIGDESETHHWSKWDALVKDHCKTGCPRVAHGSWRPDRDIAAGDKLPYCSGSPDVQDPHTHCPRKPCCHPYWNGNHEFQQDDGGCARFAEQVPNTKHDLCYRENWSSENHMQYTDIEGVVTLVCPQCNMCHDMFGPECRDDTWDGLNCNEFCDCHSYDPHCNGQTYDSNCPWPNQCLDIHTCIRGSVKCASPEPDTCPDKCKQIKQDYASEGKYCKQAGTWTPWCGVPYP